MNTNQTNNLVSRISILIILSFFLSTNLSAQYLVSPQDTIDVLFGQQKKELMTSSITTIRGDYVKNVPNDNISNALTGLLPGFAFIQNNGEPGEEGGAMLLRGQRSLINNSPWVLVDGIQRGLNWLEPDEIESVSILKDAAATSIYGMRGSNGVILVTTKRGLNQKLSISLDSRVAMQSPVKLPTFLDSYNYAKLYNEALINDGKVPYYSKEALDHYLNKDDLSMYPNNNYIDMYLKDYSVNQKYNLSVRGGNNAAKYYFLVGYTSNSGLYNVDKTVNTYNTNATVQMYSVRSNVDVQVNENFDLKLNLAARMQDRIYPGMRSNSVGQIFSTLLTLPPNLFPEKYIGSYEIVDSNGSPTGNTIINPLGGNAQYQNNPYGLLNNRGYSAYKSMILNSTLVGNYKLNFITSGLSVYASLSYDSNYAKNANRSKDFAVYELVSDTTVRQHGSTTTMSNTWTPVYFQRRIDIQAGINYDRSFGFSSLSGLLRYNYNKYAVNGNNLPNLNSGMVGRLSYAYDSKYLAEFSFAYQGTEQFPKEDRYGFFPAFSVGWNIANEDFIKEKADFINVLKLRGSVGLTGSDKGIPYFYYIEDYAQRGSMTIGVDGATAPNTAWYQATIANPNITWEKNRKANVGLDGVLFKNKLNFSFDLFQERSYDILIRSQQIPSMFGGQTPQINRGIVENEGVEFMIGYQNQLTNDFSYFINGNFAVSKNTIINQDEQFREYDYQIRTGRSIGERFGLIALGLFQTQGEIDASPSQAALGVVRPGDIKYKDMNNDGKIDSDDESPIGINQLPLLTYSISFGLQYKNFDFKGLLQGVGQSEAMLSGIEIFEFVNNGKVKPNHLNRWAYYVDPISGENVDTRALATYPRLTISEGNNNRQPSTYWLRDVSYLRLKTIELGYSIEDVYLFKTNLFTKARIYFSGYNLFTFTPLKEEIDPEMVGNATNYPIQRVFNVGLNLTF